LSPSTARPHKVDTLKKPYPNANGKLEAVEMADLVLDAGKWPEILKGKDPRSIKLLRR
jgi:hypothetical protein